MSNLNINQFAQVAIRGQLDLQISRSGVLQGQVSANQATALTPGTAVDLDSTITVVGAPQFIAALYTDSSFGYMVYDVKSASVSAPNFIQVAMNFTGPVVWLLAGATITPGTPLEQANSTTVDVVAYGTSSSKLRGWALDPGTNGNLMRVILAGGSKSLL